VVVPFTAVVLLCLGVCVAGASSNERSRLALPTWFTAIPVLAPVVLGWVRRKQPIGGWLLVYLWETTLRALVALGAGAYTTARQIDPHRWPDRRMYVAYLAAELPSLILAAIEAAVAVWGSRPAYRSPGVVVWLKRVLWVQLVAGAVACVLDARYWMDNFPMSVLSLAWPVVWLAYFHASRRVMSVFQTAPEAPISPDHWTHATPLG